jgi:transcriptional regulator with PAS, ATPase and Fis domain
MITLSNCPGSGSRDTVAPTLSSPNLAKARTEEAIRERLARTPSLLPWTELLGVVAEQDVPVLLTGETGAGKTWLARIIHDCSPCKHEPFVTVACGALPPQLVDSEFFGHVRGAFTGADHHRIGKIAAAGRGTLLLDEVDTLSIEQQAKLLRVLDSGDKVYRRRAGAEVGSSKVYRKPHRITPRTISHLQLLTAARPSAA